LAAGLAKAHPDSKILCFDHFAWAGGANWSQKSGTEHQKNEDFLPDFLNNTKVFSNQIEAVRSTIANISLPDGDVEIMVLDAPKRLNDISAILKQLAGKTIPGKTILAWQDFKHGASFEIAATLFALSDKIIPIHSVTKGCMLAFRVRETWDEEDVTAEKLDFSQWSAEDCRDIWNYWMAVMPVSQQPSFAIGLLMLLNDLGHINDLQTEARRIVEMRDEPLARKMDKWAKTSLATRYAAVFEAYDDVVKAVG
jgi:hypothetical protein